MSFCAASRGKKKKETRKAKARDDQIKEAVDFKQHNTMGMVTWVYCVLIFAQNAIQPTLLENET